MANSRLAKLQLSLKRARDKTGLQIYIWNYRANFFKQINGYFGLILPLYSKKGSLDSAFCKSVIANCKYISVLQNT